MNLYRQYANEITAMIDAGQLRPGDRLPSVREARARRGISASTVFQAYQLLERDGLQLENEGCLSLPGFTATVPRPARVVVRGLDRSSRTRDIEGTGLLARALQHEMDHLEGRLYVNRLPRLRRQVMLRRLRWLQARGEW